MLPTVTSRSGSTTYATPEIEALSPSALLRNDPGVLTRIGLVVRPIVRLERAASAAGLVKPLRGSSTSFRPFG